MSISRRFALPFMAASVVVVLSAAAALAQVGPNNPSGGTGLRQTRSEGPVVSSPATTVWKGWYGNFAVSRYGVAFAGRTWDLRSPSAFLRRPTVLR
jgi:hypothetical protein